MQDLGMSFQGHHRCYVFVVRDGLGDGVVLTQHAQLTIKHRPGKLPSTSAALSVTVIVSLLRVPAGGKRNDVLGIVHVHVPTYKYEYGMRLSVHQDAPQRSSRTSARLSLSRSAAGRRRDRQRRIHTSQTACCCPTRSTGHCMVHVWAPQYANVRCPMGHHMSGPAPHPLNDL